MALASSEDLLWKSPVPDLIAEIKSWRELFAPVLLKGLQTHILRTESYGLGTTAWVWLELVLSFPDASTAVVT